MNDKLENPTLFPVSERVGEVQRIAGDVTLRDYFFKGMMEKFVGAYSDEILDIAAKGDLERLSLLAKGQAKVALLFADAMLKARMS